MAVNIVSQTFQLDAGDIQFLEYIQNKITAYGMIPYRVPEQMMIDCIKDCARYFYKYYWRSAAEKLWGLISKDDIKRYSSNNGYRGSDGWNGKNPVREIISYSIKLPPSVRVIEHVFFKGAAATVPNDLNSGALQDTFQLLNRQYNTAMSGGASLLGINNNLYIQETITTKIVQNNAFRSIAGVMVSYSYNPTTKILVINHEITDDLIICYTADIHLHELYQDDYFRRYVVACVKRELKRVLAGHEKTLPGGVTLNPDEICNNLEDIENIEQYLKESSGVGDVIYWRQ